MKSKVKGYSILGKCFASPEHVGDAAESGKYGRLIMA
jgi:hypothetical protein